VSSAAYSELAATYGLDERAADRLQALGERVISDPEAPTTVRSRQGVLDDHLADSLVALRVPAVQSAQRVADLGAGGGFPGLPLAIALPAAQIFLVESNGRKCAFIQRAVDLLELGNATVVNDRAESWVAGIGAHDVVTARALAPLDVLAEYAAPLLEIGGHLVAWRGKREAEGEAQAARAAEILGLSVHPPVQVFPYPAAAHRYLHLMSKVRETPERFPRRPGMARKRPLGAGV
jgi:16S rRNA (guanine527-N7)-methyltransferase